MNKNQEIECLRGVAILFTLFHHIAYYLVIHPNQTFINLYSQFTFWAGVDLFFAISGFVIMNSLIQTLAIPNISFGKYAKIFWAKRIFRILPAAWFWLVVYLIFTKYFNYYGAFGDLAQNLQDAKAAVLQYANIYGVNCWGKNATMSCGDNGIYWSLSLEEQFYLIIPVLAWLLKKYLKYFLSVILLILIFVERPEWSWGWALRTDALILGVLIAIFLKQGALKKIEHSEIIKNKFFTTCIMLVAIFLMAYLPAKPNHILFSTGLVALVCAVLVLLASFNKNYLFFGNYLKKVLLWFGSRSYSLYLTHIIIFRLSYEIFYQITPAGYRFVVNDWYYLLAISIPLLGIMAEFSYRFIEMPTRNYGYRLAHSILNKN